MEIPWKESIRIPDGNHSGEIIKIEYREEPFRYTDIIIKIDLDADMDVEIKYGCPTLLSENSKLGRVLQTFGAKFEKGKKADPEKVLIKKRVKFMTLTKQSKKDGKEYAEIVEDSIKPEIETEKVKE